MIKYNSLAAGLAALIALAPVSLALARELTVTGPPSLDTWSERVFYAIDNHLSYPVEPLNRMSTGIVAVKFNCSDSGAPAGVALYKSSGSRSLDEATLRAVRHVASLHPLPEGIAHGQQFVVRVLFADSQANAANQITQIREAAKKNNEWFGKRPPALGSIVELVPPKG